jgi:hypothetical protein
MSKLLRGSPGATREWPADRKWMVPGRICHALLDGDYSAPGEVSVYLESVTYPLSPRIMTLSKTFFLDAIFDSDINQEDQDKLEL